MQENIESLGCQELGEKRMNKLIEKQKTLNSTQTFRGVELLSLRPK